MNCPTCGQPMPNAAQPAVPAQPAAAQPAWIGLPVSSLPGAGSQPAPNPRIGGFAPGVQPAAFDPSQIQATDIGSWQRPRPEWFMPQGGGFGGGVLDQIKNMTSHDVGFRLPYRGGLLGRFG